ncbi:amino acid permease [Mycolicibacterium madagascariense]|uniref:Amino acid permease n=1 Tax=Mycolicibacterium madagascariense TaxID=212765 RepID=A0A7I7XFK0_9MYCO|nr:APC family permease [Mycolicibacterium madagascariense]MCV7013980.1 APC family permease [Mycolicibacterium madagascariense]BBZ27980.1 amino acid permease [Mycolicibacterium madagascariense]
MSVVEPVGYTSPLEKTLHLRSLVLFGLAYTAPLIVLGTFGVIAVASDGGSAGSYLLATVAMLFTALSYGILAKHFPVAGSAYTYVRKAIDARVGFIVGWTILLDYLFLPLVIWLIGASYLTNQFPAVPAWVWIVAFIVVTSALNLVGLKVADKANLILMTFQVLILVLFVVLAVAHLVRGHQTLVSTTPFVGAGGIGALAAGAAIAAYSFLGFDAVSTLTEETHDAERNIPRGIVLVAVIAGVIFIVVAYSATLVAPGGTFDDADSLSSEIAKTIGGSLFGAFFLAALIIAQFTSGLAAQAAVARLLFAMGRDGVLPKQVFGLVSAKFHTPWFNILLAGVIGLGAIFLDVSTSTSFINFGAFTAFTLVNVAVIAYFIKHRRTESLHPGRYVVIPIIGALVDAALLTQLDSKALILGGSWLTIGIVYLLVLTRGFTRQPPDLAGIAEAG